MPGPKQPATVATYKGAATPPNGPNLFSTAGGIALGSIPIVGGPAHAAATGVGAVGSTIVAAGGGIGTLTTTLAKWISDPIRVAFVVFGFILLTIGAAKLVGGGASTVILPDDQNDESPEQATRQETTATEADTKAESKSKGGRKGGIVGAGEDTGEVAAA